MELGVYYNPLWATKSAVTDPSVTVVGRPDVKVADIVNPNDYFDGGGQLQWVDATRDGAEEYVKGYVRTSVSSARCSSASTSSPTTRPGSTRTTAPWAWTTGATPTCGRCSGCARRRATCS